MAQILLYCVVLLGHTFLHAATPHSPCVLVRGNADYSLVLGLVENTPVEVQMMPKRQAGCACCQHGVPHTHMTVSEARSNHKRCIMPPLRQWTNLTQCIRMVKKWTNLLIHAFPANKTVFLANQDNLLKTLTQTKAKWHNVDEERTSAEADTIDIAPTVQGYVDALEKWFESQKAVTHADIGRSLHTAGTAGG